jgi:hypothetical protein
MREAAMRNIRMGALALCLGAAALSTGAQELTAPQGDAVRNPVLQPHVAEPRSRPPDASAISRADSYRMSLQSSIQQLERAQSTDRSVQDRLWQLRSELARTENRLTDAKRR